MAGRGARRKLEHAAQIHADRFAGQWQLGGLGQRFARQMIDVHAEQLDQFTVHLIRFRLEVVQLIAQIVAMERVLGIVLAGECALGRLVIVVQIAVLDGQCVGGRGVQEAGGPFNGAAKVGVFGAIAQFEDPAEAAFADEFVVCNGRENVNIFWCMCWWGIDRKYTRLTIPRRKPI